MASLAFFFCEMTYAKDDYSEITPMIALNRSVTVDGGLIAKCLAIGEGNNKLVVKEKGVYVGCPCRFDDEGKPMEEERLRYYSLHSVIEAIQELNRRTAWMENDMGVSESFALTDQLGTGNVNTYHSTTKDLLPGLRSLEEEIVVDTLLSGTINLPFSNGLIWTQYVNNVAVWRYTFMVSGDGKVVTFGISPEYEYFMDDSTGEEIKVSNVIDSTYVIPYGTITDSNETKAIVNNMSNMFKECKRLTKLDASGWNTSNVTDMSNMFYYCTSLKELDVSGWNTSKVTNMSKMFYGCHALQTIELSGWNTSNVTNMGMMFNGCYALQSLDLSKWNTSTVTNMDMMFSGCNSLTTVMVSQSGANILEELIELSKDWVVVKGNEEYSIATVKDSTDWTEFTNDGSTTLTFTRTV